MADQGQHVAISAPSLPKGGGAIQSIGKGWGAVGATGAASLDIPLPITPGRGLAPALALSYQSSVGNGLFGLGWDLNVPVVRRRASKGVPLYTDDDVILGPDGGVWLAERDANGAVVETSVDRYGDLELGKTHHVIRYFARNEGAFARLEFWRAISSSRGFWLWHGADGSLSVFGRRVYSLRFDPDQTSRVAEWLLEETVNPLGEHILYDYKAEDLKGLEGATDPGPSRNFKSQLYLWRVRYGNAAAHPHLYLWKPSELDDVSWHFHLLFDYGERDDSSGLLAYEADRAWEGREDFHSSFAYGFELGNLRFVHYVLMFHDFPQELDADGPTLISALKLNYDASAQGCKVLASVESLAWSADAKRTLERRPPVHFSYQDFESGKGGFKPFDAMPGLNDGQRYHLVDLFGEGLPGVLYRDDKGWLYREPIRDEAAADPDAVAYGPWQVLPTMPNADSSTEVRQSLMDLTGQGQLDWIVAQPGHAGFFSLNPRAQVVRRSSRAGPDRSDP